MKFAFKTSEIKKNAIKNVLNNIILVFNIDLQWHDDR